MSEKEFKSGFVAVVGPTNSGKSTLVNALVGKKISIVSPKVQTTYHGIRGILTTKEEQIVFTDTPGFQRYREQIARLLNKVAERQAMDCDQCVWVFDATEKDPLHEIETLRKKITNLKPKEASLCVLNKADKIQKDKLLPLIGAIHALELFSDIIPVSALKKDNLTALRQVIKSKLKAGPAYFPEGIATDRSDDFLFAEFVREKIYQATKQEIPYAVRVEMENWGSEFDDAKVPTIRAILHVDGASRKPILIGKQGEMLKRIGTLARQEIEAKVGKQVCLKLHVDVQSGWRDSSATLHHYLELDQ